MEGGAEVDEEIEFSRGKRNWWMEETFMRHLVDLRFLWARREVNSYRKKFGDFRGGGEQIKHALSRLIAWKIEALNQHWKLFQRMNV